MSKDNNSRLSRTEEGTSLRATGIISSENIEDGQASSGSNEDDINLQCTSANMYKNSNEFNKDHMFVIVDSSCVSNPSSTEILINKINVLNEVTLKKNQKNNVIPIDTPCTSKDQSDILPTQLHNCESREELQMVEINLQSDNEIPIADNDAENEPESIVIAYLRNRETLRDNDEIFTTRKKSLFENVPKMETILEELSENSLDVHIPSYPGSPRSLNVGSGTSYTSDIHQDERLKEAIEFLHEDKEFLLAAEIGNDNLLAIYIRRGMAIQQVDHLGRNALHLAVCSGNLRAIKLLLDAGVDPNVKDNVGMTPLSLSLMRR
ncbi:uncharacterized protein LOC126772043 [Nymphalis io]|uniref:uncharacterized protein LOC126772043 n=1 Tax=Inachis io TaxID=171585 RepID=UPI002169457A|nr:uncharacterized protein LOC126772043 [Nymphalis io]